MDNNPYQPAGKSPVKVSTKPKNKKVMIILLVILGVLILGFIGYIVYKRYFVKEKTATTVNIKKSDKIANGLDGTLVSPDLANRHTLAIVIENHPEARPQVGLDKASIVYEAISEGGITRFLALYGPYNADKIGPVRSARTYFIDWLSEFNAFFAHCGGNLDALDKVKADNILDLDQFALGDSAYWREPRAGIASEHTLFTSTDKLYNAAKEKNWPMTADFTPYKFLKTQTPGTTAGKVTIDFSSASYKVDWTFDSATGNYLRNMAGAAHKDATSGEQLTAKTIIIQSVERRVATTAINENGWAMTAIGTGKAIVISNGTKTDATWKKDSRTARTIFYDARNQEIQYLPGRFWIEITPPDIFDKVKIEPVTAALTQ
jgi:hypothetical protein